MLWLWKITSKSEAFFKEDRIKFIKALRNTNPNKNGQCELSKVQNLDYLKKNTTLMADPKEIEYVMDRVPENVKLLLDVAHLKVSSNILKFDLIKVNEQIEKFVAAYHLSDNDGFNDTNDLITKESWFIKKLKQNALFYTIEVYKNNPNVLLQQYKLVKKILNNDK